MRAKRKVMIVGSHTITRIDRVVRMKISKLCGDGWYILVGDHSGLDRDLQERMRDEHTDLVRVYTARTRPQYNLGRWPVRYPPSGGRWADLPKYLRNTLAMADAAHCGMVVWDGSSMGTYYVAASLIEQGKPVWVYLPERGAEHTLRTAGDLEELLRTYMFPK